MSLTSTGSRAAIRTVAGLIAAAAVICAVVLVVSRATDSGTSAPVTTVSPLSPATVTRGALVKTVKVDGTLQYSDTLTVWHRISGQPARMTSASAAATAPAGGRNAVPQGGLPRAPHRVNADSVITRTACTPSTTAPSSSAPLSSAVAPATAAPCSSGGGGGGGGGATRPGGGSSRSSGSAAASVARVTQIVTSIVATGTTIGNGDVLYTIDSQPVLALIGAIPEWRTVSVSSANGSDIKQLEQALVDLGYDPDGAVTVDEKFDSTTEAMVKRWQTGLGITASGIVTLGSVVFIPKASAVAAVARAVGDSVGDADVMLTLAGASQRVVIDVPAGDEQYFVPGLSVRLSAGGTGTVELLQSVSRNSTAVVQAVIVPDAPIASVDNGTTVTVNADLQVATDVFVVPAQALVSRLDGSYAVQVRAADRSVSWLPVTLVGVAGLAAGVIGTGLVDGLTVLAPSA